MAALVSKVPILAELLHQYYEPGELQDVGKLFGVELPELWYDAPKQQWLAFARELVERLEQGNHHLLLRTLLEQLQIKNVTAIGQTDWEGRTAHERLRPKIAELEKGFEKAGAPGEIAVPEGSTFTAKSQVRELLATAATPVLVVDPYAGVGTLDCLRSVSTPIRLLTASIEPGFDSALAQFRSEGFRIDVRRVPMLHDRHLAFNDRCWLVGSSLKDAGRKAFHCMEVVDLKPDVVRALEAKWTAGTTYP
ncbi:MAG: hypothetical protein HY615_01755 [Candidatus Rokubacteria bacterium]|nr:hypothetical protein [Candidatus Rokubacteria bacterium]